MNTLLVLTDFSPTAKYAALYACILAEQLQSREIVLYHSYLVAVPVSDAAVVLADKKMMSESAMQYLKELEEQIKVNIPQNVVVRHRTDAVGLNNINTVAKEEGAGLIIMGTANKTKLEEIFLGSNAITVCKSSDYPVVLIPAGIAIQPVQKIVFACDMHEVEKTVPVTNLKTILDDFKVPLTILNVDNEDKHFTPETPMNTMVLDDMLEQYDPSYYNINSTDVAKGIIEFAKRNPATIVLLISKRHNFLEGFFYRSLTRQLAYAAPFPLLILREKKLNKNTILL